MPGFDPFAVFDLMGSTLGSMNMLSAYPAIDLVDEGEKYKIFAEMPNTNKEDITVKTEEGQFLCISGSRARQLSDADQKNALFQERFHGEFKRCLRLETFQSDEVKASFNDGVLLVEIPKISGSKDKVPCCHRLEMLEHNYLFLLLLPTFFSFFSLFTC
ncbi:HSP20 family protein [Strigomonas culicis]|uniref:HSP20 family protein n=1 Tax=Strigomonas culicis TaxID=28005 RepID=S9WAX9_9TRYP|nr:HSP20 family protein [Strigomonas culicis]|eukprot:EPY33110.1 HSP20 family protein [Strigomonas culicis]